MLKIIKIIDDLKLENEIIKEEILRPKIGLIQTSKIN
jgi:hypothetical protein